MSPSRDISEIIDDMRMLVQDAKAVPLSASVLVPREEMMALISECLQAIPEEIYEARQMAKERSEYLARVELEGEQILEAARSRAEQLISQTELARSARSAARDIILGAKEEAARMRFETEDYLDQRLASFEIVLGNIADEVRAGRERLEVRRKEAAPEPEAPEDEDAFFDQDGSGG